MSIRFPGFEASVDRTILARGQNMYEEDTITQVHAVDDNEWLIHVQSERLNNREYKVRIQIEAGEVVDYRCNCPYRMGPVCKHIVAGLYEIRESDLYEDVGYNTYTSNEEEGDDDGEDGEEEEEEDEESINGSPVNNRALGRHSSGSKDKKKKSVNVSSQETKATQSQTTVPSQAEIEEKIKRGMSVSNMDNVEKEFHCQICLGDMSEPVSMPCNAHSMCRECALIMFQHQKKEANGHKLLSCPTCREGSGVLKLKKPTDIKVNLELKRVKEAYEFERRVWLQEKIMIEENSQKIDNSMKDVGLGVDREVKNGKSKDIIIEEEIKQMDKKKLEALAIKIFVSLQEKGTNMRILLNKAIKDTEDDDDVEDGSESEDIEKENKKDNRNLTRKSKAAPKTQSKVNLRRKNRDDDQTEQIKEERYPLRNLKRLKTSHY